MCVLRLSAVIEVRPRTETDLTGRSVPNFGWSVGCKVLDRSPGGAQVRVNGVFGLPETFMLEIPQTEERPSDSARNPQGRSQPAARGLRGLPLSSHAPSTCLTTLPSSVGGQSGNCIRWVNASVR
jgi:hypothetical protein